MDVREIRLGQEFESQLRKALVKSKVLLAIVTPRYLASSFTARERSVFEERSRVTGKRVFLPVLLRRSGSLPDPLSRLQMMDFTKLPLLTTTQRRRTSDWAHAIMNAARVLKDMIEDAPPYDPGFNTSLRDPAPDVGDLSIMPGHLPKNLQ